MAVDPKTLRVGEPLAWRTQRFAVKSIEEKMVFFDDGDFVSINGRSDFWDECERVAVQGVAGHPRFLSLLDELRSMHLAKSADYGTTEDIFANFHGSTAMGIPPWQGAVLRLTDKVFRIQSFIKNGNLKNEPLMDSFVDLASYALIAAVLFEEEKEK
jgi:hypothetical protein